MSQQADEMTGSERSAGPRREGPLWTLPNQLTVARLVLSLIFFIVLALENHGVFGAGSRTLVLNLAAAGFALAVSTDFLDGWVARRWGLVSTFGRIADPFADKIIVCGSFIMLIDVSPLTRPWFAVIILFREFLVSALRSFLESRGIPFGAMWSGKVKMFVQSFAIPAVLLLEANFSASATGPLRDVAWLAQGMYWLTVGLLAATLLTTVGSCFGYIARAVESLRESDG